MLHGVSPMLAGIPLELLRSELSISDVIQSSSKNYGKGEPMLVIVLTISLLSKWQD